MDIFLCDSNDVALIANGYWLIFILGQSRSLEQRS